MNRPPVLCDIQKTGGKHMSATILMVEDNPHYLKINREFLMSNGYKVLEADTLAKGRELFLKEIPSLIILDIMLPDGDGVMFCEELREDSDVPVLFLSAKKADSDVIMSFEAGGDDYLSKPYNLIVLLKRIEALLRNSTRIPKTLVKGMLTLDPLAGQAFLCGADLLLSQKEFSLLLLFFQNEDKILSAEHIFEKVWKAPLGKDKNTLQALISTLRKKIEKSGYGIIARRGRGYEFKRM
jgi:DNA-binding response OmpR family regulator